MTRHGVAWRELGAGAPTMPAPLPLHDLPPRAAPDVVVVGLGASGLEAVVALAERGAHVVGLDAHGIAAGAAGANGGFLLAGLALFHHDAVAALGRAAAVRWYRRTTAELDRLADAEPTFRRVGSLRTAADAAEVADVAAHLAALRRDGFDASPFHDDLGAGLVVHGDGAVHPVARCARLATRAVAAGAVLVAPAPVTAVATGAVHLAGRAQPLRTTRVLVAVDGGLERLLPALAPRVRTARLQMRASAPEPVLRLAQPRYHRGGADYVQQLPTGEVLLGGGRDVGGDAEWDAPAAPSPTVQRHLDRWAAALGVGAPVTHRWAARAAFTPDRLPVDARVAPGVHVVGAHSGHGNVLGGLLAREAGLALLDGAAPGSPG